MAANETWYVVLAAGLPLRLFLTPSLAAAVVVEDTPARPVTNCPLVVVLVGAAALPTSVQLVLNVAEVSAPPLAASSVPKLFTLNKFVPIDDWTSRIPPVIGVVPLLRMVNPSAAPPAGFRTSSAPPAEVKVLL